MLVDKIFLGIRSDLVGIQLLRRNRSLLLWSIGPFFIYLALFFAGVYLVGAHLGTSVTWFLDKFPIGFSTELGEAWYWSLLEWPLVALQYMLRGLLYLSGIVFIFLSLFIAGGIVVGPVYDLISEKTESVLGIETSEDFTFQRLIHSIKTALIVESKKLILLAPIPILGLLLALIPVVGIIISVILVNIYTCIAFAFTFIDLPMGRRDWTFKERVHWCRKNWVYLVGFGFKFYLPVFNFVGAPLFVISATYLFCEIEKQIPTPTLAPRKSKSGKSDTA